MRKIVEDICRPVPFATHYTKSGKYINTSPLTIISDDQILKRVFRTLLSDVL